LNTTDWAAIVVTGLCFLVMVASGGFLSADKPMPVALLRVHQIGPALATLSSAATLYLVLGR
jgi:membrane protease YdiL (CAAX protease family)